MLIIHSYFLIPSFESFMLLLLVLLGRLERFRPLQSWSSVRRQQRGWIEQENACFKKNKHECIPWFFLRLENISAYGSAHPAAALLIPTCRPLISSGPPLSPFEYLKIIRGEPNFYCMSALCSLPGKYFFRIRWKHTTVFHHRVHNHCNIKWNSPLCREWLHWHVVNG